MIKRVPAVQTTDGSLFSQENQEEAKRHEFELQLCQLFKVPAQVDGAGVTVSPSIPLADIVRNMDGLTKALKEATELVDGAKAF